jgi:hypothetical protein
MGSYKKFGLALMMFLTALTCSIRGVAQAVKPAGLVYVDAAGRMRWTKDKTEVYLFGVNYTVPFAYGYRSVKALNVDLEKEIDNDVYHLARMGADAFRVHIWDTEISDTAGNLLQNEHLKLFDYLVYKLTQRNIKIIITPIAFWGNGYPERDEHTAGFSTKYNKGQATINENAIKAQENYLKQLLQHVNPYTKLSYSDEPAIIAAELNNEPSHSGPKAGVTAYINRLVAAARSTGWSKPLFYNISQSPYYADAVAKSTVNGFSFQWYPTGLVAGHEQKGNYLPNVDKYHIPYDTIPEYKNKARMIYEFDAADVLQSCIYPAVARSFKQAGFQWVTQFAYDPLATAYGNTEYQTHFLNLAYTPAKAISFLIANRVFHLLPKDKNYGTYPADSVFDAYHVSYDPSMSQMNRSGEFYYSGNTSATVTDLKKLEHIAGVGSSKLINYQGSGAYFADKLESGVWRLEVMPDAVTIMDPFERPSPSREAVNIQWNNHNMTINLTDLGNDFTVRGINKSNTYQTSASNHSFIIKPGTYLLIKKGKSAKYDGSKKVGNLYLNEFVAPQPVSTEPYVSYTPPTEVAANMPFEVKANIVNLATDDKVTLVINHSFGPPAIIGMQQGDACEFKCTVPAEQVITSVLSYKIMIQRGDKQYIVFPGGYKGDPYQWDNINNDSWQTFVAAPGAKLTLFDPTTDQHKVNTYFAVRVRSGGAQFVSGEETGRLAFRVSTPLLRKGQVMGMQLYIGDKLKNRLSELSSFNQVTIRGRMQNGTTGRVRVVIIDKTAAAYAAYVDFGSDFKNIDIPLSAFKPDSSLLLPRPYPDFQPLWFKASGFAGLELNRADKLEVTVGDTLQPGKTDQAFGVDITGVWLGHH